MSATPLSPVTAAPGQLRSPPSVAILEQAAQWYATLSDEAVTAQDRTAWNAWLARSEDHARAWQHIDAVSRRFAPLRIADHSSGAAAVAGVAAARRGSTTRRRSVTGLGAMAALGLIGALGWRYTPLPRYVAAWRADESTAIGEQRALHLADGTRLWLNTASAVRLRYNVEERRVVLLTGEILVQTGLDAQQRPFYVQTPFGRLEALGTRFNVALADAVAQLDVFEGTVEIRTAGNQVQRVGTGGGAHFSIDEVSTQATADRVREAWSRQRLPADDMPLGQLLAELARYRSGHISVAPEVAQLRVMGVYPTDDTDRALAMLERNLPIRVRRSLPWWTTVEAR